MIPGVVWWWWWCGFLTDYKTTPTKVVLSCFGLFVGLWQFTHTYMNMYVCGNCINTFLCSFIQPTPNLEYVLTRQIRRFVKLCFRSSSALFLDKTIMHNRFPGNVFSFIFLEKFTNHLNNTCKSTHTDQRGKNAFYPEGSCSPTQRCSW